MMQEHAVRVLGPMALSIDGQVIRLSPGRRSTLARLLAGGPDGVEPSEFLGADRPDTTTERSKVRVAVSRLRGSGIPDDWVVLDGGRYRVDLSPSDVDIWHLADLAERGELPPSSLLARLLRPSTPFEDVGSTELLDRATTSIRRDQRRLLERVRSERPDLLADFTETLIRLADADPFDERLVELTVRALVDAGRAREALQLLATTHRDFADVGLSVNSRLREFERRVLAGDHVSAAPSEESRLPTALQTRLEGHRVGSVAPVDRLLDVLVAPKDQLGAAVVTGPAGSGKSRLLADAARSAHERGWRVLFAAGTPSDNGAPYVPLIGALGAEGQDLIPELATDVDRHRLVHFRLLTDAFRRASANRRSILIVDDAQWVDQYTAGFLARLDSVALGGVASVWMGGRPDGTADGDGRWASVSSSFATHGAVTVALEPFSPRDMEDFVTSRRPKMRKVVRDRVARELQEASAGLPGIAGPLLASLTDEDAELARLPESAGSEPLVRLLQGLPAETRRVALAIGLIDEMCTIDELSAVFAAVDAIDDHDLLEGVAELVDRELVSSPHDHQYEIAHLLIRQAMRQLGSAGDRARLHLAAATVFEADADRAAWHRWLAVPLVSLADAADGLVASARRLMDRGAHARAADLFGRVHRVLPQRLSLTDRGAWARALDLGGARERARSERHAAVREAVAADEWRDALDIATSGLPETEAFDGDAELVDQLRSIPLDQLSEEDSWRCRLHLARQAVLLGDPSFAESMSEGAGESANTSSRRVELAMCRRWALATDRPAARLDVLAEVEGDVDLVNDELRSEYLVNLIVDRFEAGVVDDAEVALRSVTHRDRLTDRRRWYLAMIEATMAAEREQPDAADLRRIAYEIGIAAGVGEADNSLLIAEFAELWMHGAHAGLLPLVRAGTIGTEAVLLSSAAAAAVCRAAGEDADAIAFAEVVFARADSLPAAGGAAAVALVSEIAREAAEPAVVDHMAQVLRRRRPSWILVGAGAACLGPSDRYLARLVASDDERVELLQSAIELASSAGLVRWARICRSDLEVAAPTE